MPLYEYHCSACGSRFEVLQRMGETAEGLACPECGRPKPEREVSTFASSGTSSGGASSSCSSGGRFT
jgi:putative FmdB family regulatory protein